MSAALPAWWTPRVRAVVDGQPWASDGVAAFRGLECSDGRDVSEEMPRLLGEKTTRTLAEERRTKGYAVLGGRLFRAHYVDWAERIFPGLAWQDGATDTGPAVGRVGGEVVALLMPLRPGSFQEETVEPGYPRCPTCEGSGAEGACKVCAGTKYATCPHCEQDMTCKACGGSGRFGVCGACKGSKYDMPAETQPGGAS